MEYQNKLRILEKTVTQAGLEWNPDFLARFEAYLSLLLEERGRQRIIGPTDPDEIINQHFQDSVQPLHLEKPSKSNKWLDIGSGAGLPGIPISILNPSASIYLLETSHKRVSFLKKVKAELALSYLEVLEGRAEDFAHDQKYRGQFQVVLARAVSSLPVLIELGLPFLKSGGYLFAQKGPKAEEEIKESVVALKKVGGVLESTFHYTLSEEESGLRIIKIKKTGKVPNIYPRKAGIPQKNPLK